MEVSALRTDRSLVLAVFVALAFPVVALGAPLVGPSVGSADALQAEANKLFNKKQYAQAADLFLQATRANPGQLAPYLSLARAQLQLKRHAEACNAYRAYLRSAPEGSERNKAQGELTLCERQLASSRKTDDLPRQYVELKAAFYAALEQQQVLGEDGAAAALRALVSKGYLSTDLSELADKLHAEALRAADAIHARALSHEQVAAQQLVDGRDLFDLAADVGPEPKARKAKASFLAGRAELEIAAAKKIAAESVTTRRRELTAEATAAAVQAVEHFAEAVMADPAQAEYKFFRALAIYRRGDVDGALAALRRDLPDDPRTTVLGAIQTMRLSKEGGAAEIERVLFSSRYPERR